MMSTYRFSVEVTPKLDKFASSEIKEMVAHLLHKGMDACIKDKSTKLSTECGMLKVGDPEADPIEEGIPISDDRVARQIAIENQRRSVILEAILAAYRLGVNRGLSEPKVAKGRDALNRLLKKFELEKLSDEEYLSFAE